MTDAKYLFKKTELERKRIGRGDFNKKRQGGKQVRFPSDNLSKKERDAMNGEVVSYQLGKPTNWATLKSWPEDIQKAYLSGLRQTYGVGAKELGEMLGVAKVTVCHHEKRLGISAPIGKKADLRVAEWNKFLGRDAVVSSTTPAEPVPEEVLVCADEESSANEVQEKVDALDLGKLRIDHLCCLLQALKGTGAKVTIEVTL